MKRHLEIEHDAQTRPTSWLSDLAAVFLRRDDDISRDGARIARARQTAPFTTYVEHEAVKSVARRLRALRLK